jgi:hypothetical protein
MDFQIRNQRKIKPVILALQYRDTNRRITLKLMWLQRFKLVLRFHMQAILMMVMNFSIWYWRLQKQLSTATNICQIWGSCSSVAEDLCLQGCDTVLLGMQFLAFWKNMKMLWPFRKSGTSHPMTQCNIPEELNPQVHMFLNSNTCKSRHHKIYSCFNKLQAMYGDYVPLILYGALTCMGGVAALYLGWVTSKTSHCEQ